MYRYSVEKNFEEIFKFIWDLLKNFRKYIVERLLQH